MIKQYVFIHILHNKVIYFSSKRKVVVEYGSRKSKQDEVSEATFTYISTWNSSEIITLWYKVIFFEKVQCCLVFLQHGVCANQLVSAVTSKWQMQKLHINTKHVFHLVKKDTHLCKQVCFNIIASHAILNKNILYFLSIFFLEFFKRKRIQVTLNELWNVICRQKNTARYQNFISVYSASYKNNWRVAEMNSAHNMYTLTYHCIAPFLNRKENRTNV